MQTFEFLPALASFVLDIQIEGIQLKDWVLKLSDRRLYVDGKRV